MINTEVEGDLVGQFEAAGGGDKPRFVEMTVCWAKDEGAARRTAHEVWSLAALEGMLFTELPLPAHFEAALAPISEDAVAEKVVCGPDADRYLDAIEKARRTGYTHICLHQVGPEQERFLEFCQRRILPALEKRTVANGRKRNVKAARVSTTSRRARAVSRRSSSRG
jgi:coenzyme F420-dependent glucose-6-phosphate dehydrogenase